MLTSDRIDTIFKEMDEYVLELSNDPSELGPRYFQDIIATCRNYLNRVSLVVSELNKEKLIVSGELRKLEASYALEYDDLIANDDRVRTLANIEDRKATAGFLLREKKLKINELKDRQHSLDAVHKLVTYRNRELHSTMTAIKDQRRLMQSEIETGAYYGDERQPKSRRIPREPDEGFGLEDVGEVSAAELADLFSNTAEETPEVEGTPPKEPVAPLSEEKTTEPEEDMDADVERFLASPEEEIAPAPQAVVGGETASEEDDEMADLLSAIDGL